MKRYHQPSGTQATLEGRIQSAQVALGSKSEHKRPVLVLGPDSYALVHVEGDSYFDAPTLQGLIEQRVQVQGKWDKLILQVAADAVVQLDKQDSETLGELETPAPEKVAENGELAPEETNNE